MLDGAMQGATFGFGDEIAGARGALMGQVPQPDGTISGPDYSGSMGDRYRANRDAVRDMNAQSQQASPMAYGGGSLVGSVAPALAAAPYATGGSLLGTMGRGMGIGTVEGGLQGAGHADGRDLAGETLRGAGIGAGLGAAAPPVVHGAGAVRRAVSDPVTGVFETLFKRANATKANRAISNTMRASGQSPTISGGPSCRPRRRASRNTA